jgi:acetyltransferase-like isoleucine patch superfamily enzyme
MQDQIIIDDAKYFIDYHSGKIHPSVVLENGDNIFIGNHSEIRPGVILDASNGPIILAENVFIDIGSLIQGPVYIGHSSIINPGTRLRKNILPINNF